MWCGDIKKMLHDFDNVYQCLLQQIAHEENEQAVQYDHKNEGGCVWEQFTGLVDKNDKDIYEGDIVSANGVKSVRTADYSQARKFVCASIKDEFESVKERSLFVCCWNDSFSSFQFTSKTHSIDSSVADREFIVEGNIHENPELLKDE